MIPYYTLLKVASICCSNFVEACLLHFQEMADITSKAAMAPVTPKAADKPQGSSDGSGVIGGFSSLPSSIHHGLSEKLQGLTEKLHNLGKFYNLP